VEAHRSLVPPDGQISAWWQLPAEQTYMWAWLPTHLHGAGLNSELSACLHHPRWFVGKLEHVGPAGLEADLALSDDPVSHALYTAVRQNAHILGPLDPPGSLAATLATRLLCDGPTKTIAEQLVAGLSAPHLRAITAFPDLLRPAVSRTLTSRIRAVLALGAAPDGSWLISADAGGEVRMWDPITGISRHTLPGHLGRVWALVVAPNMSWLASAGEDGTVRIWDPITGTLRHALTGHVHAVPALEVAPDGAWLDSAGYDGK